MTLGIYREIDLPGARQCLADLASARPPMAVTFPFFGVFPAAEPTIFLGPLVSHALLDLQAALDQDLSERAAYPDFDYYRPGHWIPRAALAMEFDGVRLNEAMDVCRRLPLPLNGEIREIGLIEMRPVRHLKTWSFVGQSRPP